MDYSLSPELEMLQDSVRRYVRERYDFSERRRQLAVAVPGVGTHWRAFAEQGWLGAACAEEWGGSGGGAAELGVLLRELGAGLVLEPVLPALLAGRLVAALGNSERQAALLPALIEGRSRGTVALIEPEAGLDWQRGRSSVRRDGAGLVLNGRKMVVAGGAEADWLLVSARLDDVVRLLLLSATADGVRRSAYRGVDGNWLCDIVFDNVRLDADALLGESAETAGVIAAALDFATVATCFEAVGTMRRAFELTLDYLKQRVQFGQPLAANQALQHRLVDMLILLREADALSRQAWLALEGSDAAERTRAVAAAKIHVGSAARTIGQEAVQLHGGIGTTDEAEISHCFKRLLALGVNHGDARHHGARYAALLPGEHDKAQGGLSLSAADQAFCAEVRAFIATHLDPATAAVIASGRHPEKHDYVRWEQALAKRGWLAYTWPAAHGGPGWTVLQQYLFEQIVAEMNAPTVIPFGIKMVGPVLLAFGSEEQQRRHLPGVLNSTTWWCQGYSEPGAGSDLAALSTRAERRGDKYIVNGQKIWTSTAHWADWIFCLVRTSREARRQDGISFLLIDMKTPGIEVRPILSLDGHHGFNEVFFTDVEVPVENLVGEEGRGWSCAKYLLSHERLEVVSLPQIKVALQRLRRAAGTDLGGRRLRDDPVFAARLVDIEVRTRAVEARVVDLLAEMMAGGSPGPEVSGLKIRGTELSQDILELTMEAAGAHALAHDFGSAGTPANRLITSPDFAGNVTGAYLYRRAWTILGGSTEVQKNIMSKALLGL